MSNSTDYDLHAMAAKITTSYSKANPVPAHELMGVLKAAFLSLRRCAMPVETAAPAAPEKTRKRRGRPKSR